MMLGLNIYKYSYVSKIMVRKKFQIYIEKQKLFSNSQNSFNLTETKDIGEKSKGIVNYSLYEAYYLKEKNFAEIVKNKKVLSDREINKTFSRIDKNFESKYVVYERLRKKGYKPKSALKFGCDFRVYDNKSVSKHARWLVVVLNERENLNLKELSAKVRVSHSTAKKLLIAVVDIENGVSFYETDWLKI